MKTIGMILLATGIVFSPNLLHAQTAMVGSFNNDLPPAQPAQSDSIVQVTAEAEGLSQVDPSSLPFFASCWWTVFPDGGPVPMPCPPQDLSVPIYEIVDGSYLVDETGGAVSVSTPRISAMHAATTASVASAVERQGNAIADLIEQVQETTFEQSLTMAFGMDAPSLPAFGDSGTNTYTPQGGSFTIPNYGTNLWIAQVNITNGYFTGIGSNTLADVQYEIQSRTNLAQSDWQSEGFIYGSEITNWTPLSVLRGSRTNLFIKLRSGIDSDNVGIPDWWQLQYFGYVGINPYAASPAGDGFTIWHKYQNGLSPTNFEMTPAPNNFVAVLSTNGTNVLLSWSAAQGAVMSYSVLRGVIDPVTYEYDFTQIATVSSNATVFTDIGGLTAGGGNDPVYKLFANYLGGNISQTASSYLYYSPPPPPVAPAPIYNIYASATLIRNATGRWQLMFSDLSANVQAINLLWTDSNGDSSTQNIPIAVLTNNIYQIPDTDSPNYLGDSVSVQGIQTNGQSGAISFAGVLANDAPYFVDGRQHLKQNLSFLVRAASQYWPYGAYLNYWINFNTFSSSTNFEEFSFLHPDSGLIALDNLWPFEMNDTLANCLINTAETNNLLILHIPFGTNNFDFTPNFATNIPTPAILGDTTPYWIIQPGLVSDGYNPADPQNNASDWGVTLDNTNVIASLQSGLHNLFGLPYGAGCMVDLPGINPSTGFYILQPYYQTLGLGATITAINAPTNYYAFKFYASQCPTPTFLLTNYFFAPLSNPNLNTTNLPPLEQQPFSTPLNDAFNPTNQTPPLIIGSVGQPMIIGAWAKYAVSNSSPTKYAYLGQYFMTNAFLLDSSGNVTTNSAGILSPYGEFFPTQAGQAQLITMPDLDTGKQGTNIVQVISLNVDANHDGTMDLSYFGQDQTSPSKPYVFWCNNNFDRWNFDSLSLAYEQDDMESGTCPYTPSTPTPDCNYLNMFGERVIPDTRDLEDFSRLWINGVTSNLLATLPLGSSVILSWGDVSSPNPNNPTIDLFQAADADGGIGYLTNSTVAAQQTNSATSGFIGRLGPGDSIQLNSLMNQLPTTHFIWCGAANGSGKLTLTFKDLAGNVYGQASVYIQIQDIKQMYERWTVGDNSTQPPTNVAYLAQNGFVPGETPFQYPLATTNTPYILLVHGYNMAIWEKDAFAETAFKRLYWQGYQGRFGAFNWPTAEHAVQFGSSELQAWNSGLGLLNKLNDLNAIYPGQVYLAAHSLGNVVAGEALRLAGSSQVVNTYIAMQGAVTAHAYDPTTAIYYPADDHGEADVYAHYWTNGAPCYFNASAAAGTYVNFFNPNDWALTNAWLVFQDQKINLSPGYIFGSGGTYYKNYGLIGASDQLFFPTNSYELFDHLFQCRSYALGMQINVGGAFKVGAAYNQINLQNIWPPDPLNNNYRAHIWHSGEFRSDYAQRWLFWDEVLFQMRLKNNL